MFHTSSHLSHSLSSLAQKNPIIPSPSPPRHSYINPYRERERKQSSIKVLPWPTNRNPKHTEKNCLNSQPHSLSQSIEPIGYGNGGPEAEQARRGGRGRRRRRSGGVEVSGPEIPSGPERSGSESESDPAGEREPPVSDAGQYGEERSAHSGAQWKHLEGRLSLLRPQFQLLRRPSPISQRQAPLNSP